MNPCYPSRALGRRLAPRPTGLGFGETLILRHGIVLHDPALEDPDLDPAGAVGGERGCYAVVDVGVATAFTTDGTCGVKVWIFKGEIMEHDSMAQDKRLAEAEAGRPSRREDAR